jgi:hypothetical protein
MKHFYPIVLLLVLPLATTAQQSAAADGTGSTSAIERSGPPVMDTQSANSATPSEPRDPLLDVPPMPKGTVSLVGGTVRNVDQIRDKLVVQVFGGKAMKIAFDERTHIYRDGVETTQLGVRKGDRVYVDTMLDGTRVFARNIRVETAARAADSAGQVLSVNAGSITLRDQLAAQPVTFQVDQKTSIVHNAQPASFSEVKPGAIITVKFAPERANHGMAREISIIASPGMQFIFAGKVTHLDLSSGILSVDNLTDSKTYDLSFSLPSVDKRDALGVGSEVTVLATFEGWGYRADSVKVTAAPEAANSRR